MRVGDIVALNMKNSILILYYYYYSGEIIDGPRNNGTLFKVRWVNSPVNTKTSWVHIENLELDKQVVREEKLNILGIK